MLRLVAAAALAATAITTSVNAAPPKSYYCNLSADRDCRYEDDYIACYIAAYSECMSLAGNPDAPGCTDQGHFCGIIPHHKPAEKA
jgi:hypothetical protein